MTEGVAHPGREPAGVGACPSRARDDRGQLDRVEGVSPGAFPQAVREDVGAVGAARAPDEVGEVLLGERAERDALGSGARGDRPEEAEQRRMAGSGWVPVGQDDEDARGQPFDEVAEQDARSRRRPGRRRRATRSTGPSAASAAARWRRRWRRTPRWRRAPAPSGPRRDPLDGIPSRRSRAGGNGRAAALARAAAAPGRSPESARATGSNALREASQRPTRTGRPASATRSPARPPGGSCRSPRGRTRAPGRGTAGERPATRHPAGRARWNGRPGRRRVIAAKTASGGRSGLVAGPGAARRWRVWTAWPPAAPGPGAAPCAYSSWSSGPGSRPSSSASRSRAPEYTSRASACRPDR